MKHLLAPAAAAIALVSALALPGAVRAHDGDHAIVPLVAFGALPPTPLAPRENVEYIGGHNGFTGGHVAVEGDRLYLGSYGNGLRIYDVSDPAAPAYLGQYTPGLRADAPPDAAVFDGRHIAVLNGTRRTHGALPPEARTDRTEFLDVTDPANPKLLWTFGPDQIDGESHNGDIVDERRLYLPSGGVGVQGLRIYDLSPLVGMPTGAPRNVFRGDPASLWEASPYRQGKPVGAPFTHTHDIEVYVDHPVEGLGPRDIVLLAEGGNYLGDGDTGSVFVIDITDPAAPVVLQRWLHESGPDHHPIRYHHEAQLLASDPSVMLVTDEDMHSGCGGAGGIVAVKLSPDLTEAEELSEWFIPFGTPAPVCSVHVFSSDGPLVFIGSYNAGLQVVDYSDPANPRQVGHFIAEGTTAWGALYHRGYVYVGDMARGLDVFRYTGLHADLPDLTINPGGITFSSNRITSGDRVTITARVRNAGGSAAAPVVVRFADGDTVIGERTIASIPPGEEATTSVVWNTAGVSGDRQIVVTVDPYNMVREQVEGNNSASRKVKVR
jgi:hypothetical protein